MEISNPKRILAVSLESETRLLSQAIKDLTGSHPEPHPGTSSLAGTSHNLLLSTAYYKAEVPIWIDLIASPSEWATSFTSPEAKEVLDVLGGVVVVFPVTSSSSSPSISASSAPALSTRPGTIAAGAGKSVSDGVSKAGTSSATHAKLIREIGRVMEALGGWGWDGVGLGIGVGGTGEEADIFEDACAAVGLEFVHAASEGKGGDTENEFGEKTGMDRALEALQANDWTLASLVSDDDDDFGEFEEGESSGKKAAGTGGLPPQDKDDAQENDFDPESLDFGFDRNDFEGLRKAIWSSGEPGNEGEGGEEEIGEEDVERLERMMGKLLAVRDMSSGLPEEQRKKMARKAVGEVMKEL